MQLAKGVFNGRRVVSEAVIGKMHSPQMILSPPPYPAGPGFGHLWSYVRGTARSRDGRPAVALGERPVSIEGLTEGIAYRLGGCCHPIPGDRIVGLMVPGEGVIIHAVDCEVLDRHQDSMIDWIDVRWRDRKEDSAYSITRIGVRVENTAGSLASIANIISRNGANISNLKITSRNPLYFELQIDLEVRDTQHLEHIIGALKVDSAVELVERSRGLDTDHQNGAPVVAEGETQGVLI